MLFCMCCYCIESPSILNIYKGYFIILLLLVYSYGWLEVGWHPKQREKNAEPNSEVLIFGSIVCQANISPAQSEM